MTQTLKLYDTIVTTQAFEDVPEGSIGAVLMIYDDGLSVEVELANNDEQMTYTLPSAICEIIPPSNVPSV